MRAVIYCLLLCASLGAQPLGGISRLSSNAPLEALLARSMTTVVATIQNATYSAGQASVTLQVSRSIKGDLAPGKVVFLDWSVEEAPIAHRIGATGIWFLSQVAPDKWQPLPVINSSLPFLGDFYVPARAKPYSGNVKHTPEGLLAGELASMVEQDGVSSTAWSQLDSLASELNDGAVLEPIFSRFAASSSEDLQVLAAAGLISQGNRAGYSALAAKNIARSEKPALTNIVADSICRSKKRAEDAAELVSLATANSERLAYCAAAGLAAIHNASTVPALAKLLDHPKREMRFHGVVGLAAFALNLPIATGGNNMDWLVPLPGPAPFKPADGNSHFPMLPTFEKDETEFVSFWKDWWNKNQAEFLRQ